MNVAGFAQQQNSWGGLWSPFVFAGEMNEMI